MGGYGRDETWVRIPIDGLMYLSWVVVVNATMGATRTSGFRDCSHQHTHHSIQNSKPLGPPENWLKFIYENGTSINYYY